MNTTAEDRTQVLIVGGGYAGLASAMFLSHHGVSCLLVDRHGGASVQGRARGINPRTIELYRPLGLEETVYAAGRPFENDSGGVHCQTLAGEWYWLFGDPNETPDETAELVVGGDLSPAHMCLADQNQIEPILIERARARGADLRFDTELVSHVGDADGVTALIRDVADGTKRRVRADYLIAADGQRSGVREAVGITRTGPGVVRSHMGIQFRADLSDIVWHRAILWFVVNENVRAAFSTTAREGVWSAAVEYDPERESVADYSTERCVDIVRSVVGRDDLEVEIEDVTGWSQGVAVADAYRSGRVFLVGDAAHVWSPAGGLGANSGVQDAHNLAWKLAAVLSGWAGPDLLDSYEAERRPVAQRLAEVTEERQRHRSGSTPDQDRQDDLIWIFGQRYASRAIDGPAYATVFDTTPELAARPGTRAPHAWLERAGQRISTHDLFDGAYVLLTDASGGGSCAAVRSAAERLGVPLRAFRVGTPDENADLIDHESVWSKRYDVGPGDAVLVRPDGYVAWRSSAVEEPSEEIVVGVLRRTLDRPAA